MNETLDVGNSEDEKLDSGVDSKGDGLLVPTKAHVPMMATLLDTQVENLSKGFSFVEEHGLCSTTPRAGTNVPNISLPIPFDKKRHSPRLSAEKNVLPKKVAETIVEVVVEASSSSCDGK